MSAIKTLITNALEDHAREGALYMRVLMYLQKVSTAMRLYLPTKPTLTTQVPFSVPIPDCAGGINPPIEGPYKFSKELNALRDAAHAFNVISPTVPQPQRADEFLKYFKLLSETLHMLLAHINTLHGHVDCYKLALQKYSTFRQDVLSDPTDKSDKELRFLMWLIVRDTPISAHVEAYLKD